MFLLPIYHLYIDFRINEFDNIWVNSKNKNLRGRNKELSLKLQAIESKANKEAQEMTVFDLVKFETKLF